MSKAAKVPAPEAKPKPIETRLKWPESVKECCDRPRLFRLQRLNTYEWQAYVTQDGEELPIGKPDVFDILVYKIKCVMRAEGQREFLSAKTKGAIAEEAQRTMKAADAA